MYGPSRNDITVPNIMTCFRILLALSAGMLLILRRDPATATWMCIAASLLDYFDGWYARRFHQTTKLGAHLDPFADKVLISVIFVALIYRFKWPWFTFFVWLILLREIIITIYRMTKRRRSGVFVPPSRLGKIKTVVQCFVGDSLMFFVFIYPGRIPEQTWLIFFVMMATMFITIDSGMQYILPSCSDGKKRSGLERLAQWIFGVRAREV